MFFTTLFNNSQTAKVRVQPDYLSWHCYRGFNHSSSARSCHASGEWQQLITWQFLLCYDANKIGSLNLWKIRLCPLWSQHILVELTAAVSQPFQPGIQTFTWSQSIINIYLNCIRYNKNHLRLCITPLFSQEHTSSNLPSTTPGRPTLF